MPSTARTTVPTGVAWLVAVAALTGGLLELAIRLLAARFYPWPRAVLYFDPQAVWVAPLVNAIAIGAAVGALLMVTTRLDAARRVWLVSVVAFTYAFLEPLLLVPGIHGVAMLVVAAGLAVQCTRWLTAVPGRFSVVKRAAIALGAVSVIAGIAWNGHLGLKYRLALAEIPAPARPGRSVLLIIFDTLRAMQLRSYGYTRPTSPVIDSLAARGVRFESAISTSPWTLPAHASLFTGTYVHEQPTSWVDGLDGRHVTLAGVLSDAGFVTGGFSANVEFASRHFGLDQGFDVFSDRTVNLRSALMTSTVVGAITRHLPTDWQAALRYSKRADTINADFLRWVDSLEGRPFFGFLNYYDAHAPYEPPPPFDLMFLASEPRSRNAWDERPYPADVIEGLEGAYDGGIAYADQQLGRLLAELRERGLADSLTVIVSSDHGEEFGEHDMIGHGHGLNNPAVHVPLVMASPGQAAGIVEPAPVSLRDIGATVLDLLDVTPTTPFPGTSLVGRWRRDSTAAGSPALPEVDWARHIPLDVPLAKGDMSSLVSGQWHLIRRGDGAYALFDRITDTKEQRDLAPDPSHSEVLASMQSTLASSRMIGAPVPRRHR